MKKSIFIGNDWDLKGLTNIRKRQKTKYGMSGLINPVLLSTKTSSHATVQLQGYALTGEWHGEGSRED